MPTLDFTIWQDKNGRLNHSYYQKAMKTPYIVMARSAAPQQQKIQVLSNEVTRRLLNINKKENTQQEYNAVVDKFCQEAKNSGYNHNTTREIITSGIRGWKNRLQKRLESGQENYRPARKTLLARTKKKLLSRETWYKNELKDKNDPCQDKINKDNGLPGGPRALGPKVRQEEKNIQQEKNILYHLTKPNQIS